MTDAVNALSRIQALAYCFGNADQLDMEAAAQNLANGAPAFWHRATGGNAVVGGFMFYLNRTQDVIRAWELYEHEFQRPSRMRNPKYLFELLPLNRAAAQSLAKAYDEVSVWHDPSELLSRTLTAEEKALVALQDLKQRGSTSVVIDALGGIDPARVGAAQDAIVEHMMEAEAAARPDLRNQLQASLAEAV